MFFRDEASDCKNVQLSMNKSNAIKVALASIVVSRVSQTMGKHGCTDSSSGLAPAGLQGSG